MSFDPASAPGALPSRRKLLVTTLGALAVAAVIVVTAVLPVEYNRDPLGTGKAFGLLRAPPVDQTLKVSAEASAGLEPQPLGDSTLYGAPYRSDTVTFTLQPYDFIEYKYHLAKGAGLQFAWTATAVVTHEFHGEPDDNPANVRSYDKSDKKGANGSLIAPMTGIHGWFWENPGNEPVTIKLVSSGFYTYGLEFHSDHTKQRHEMAPVNPIPDAK